MNFYRLFKWYKRINSPRLKLLGVLVMHMARKRYLYISIDPALTCNLRCRMCYFSNPEKAKEMRGSFSDEDISHIAKALFHRGLKIQIGCGAEPTTFKSLGYLVKTAHDYGIPSISITTNGNLLTHERLQQLVTDGLDEIILSAHGLDKDTYEYMMRNASFDRFMGLIASVGEIKKEHPNLKLRVNYTVCVDNIDSLKNFSRVFSNVKPDILQLRPVQDIGSSDYDSYSMKELEDRYDDIVKPLVDYCNDNGITCLYPEKKNIGIIESENKDKRHVNSVAEMLPFFHLEPGDGWKDDFNPYTETFEEYCKRTRHTRRIIKYLINPYREERAETTRSLNYNIR